jgi:hypothetical protein
VLVINAASIGSINFGKQSLLHLASMSFTLCPSLQVSPLACHWISERHPRPPGNLLTILSFDY